MARARSIMGTAADRGGSGRLAEQLLQTDDELTAWSLRSPARAGETAALSAELRAVALRLRAAEILRRQEATERLQASLRHLQQLGSTQELVDQVPDEVALLGFNRVLFSWVDHARWVPVSFHTETGPEEARAVMEAGAPPYWDLHRLLEGEMITHRRPILVRNALNNPRVHQDIQAVIHSHSYVAAPVVRRAQVVGFVSADQNVENDVVDELDRDLVHLFAEGLSLALDRVAILEELTHLRRRIGEQAQSLASMLDPASGGEAAGPRPTPQVAPAPAWDRVLTRREEEVLSLVAAGLSNAQIAQRLFVTEATAKTHVKNLVRKLGAESRAHAASMYHRHWGRSEG